jgi:hypothetical protein
MNRCLSALAVGLIGLAVVRPVAAQASLPGSGFDLLYPGFAHPQRDALAAIKKRDLRFITVDRQRKIVPGVERYPRLKRTYGTKYVKQPFRIFATRSQNFSFDLRARTYADEYNRTLLRYLLKRHRKK